MKYHSAIWEFDVGSANDLDFYFHGELKVAASAASFS